MNDAARSRIEELEARIQALSREYAELRTRMETEGVFLTQNQIEEADFDPLVALEFERNMELAALRLELDRARMEPEAQELDLDHEAER
jgi:ribosomal protein L29